MPVPTDPTLALLCTEAFKKAGILSPSSAKLTRAQDYFFEEILDDIWNTAFRDGNTRLKSLQTSTLTVSVAGKRNYDMAEEFDEEVAITILDGTKRGTAHAGGASSITLASSETALTATGALGKWVVITGGTGSAQYKQIVSYDATTNLATVESAWTTPPDATSTYLIVESAWDLDEVNDEDLRLLQPAAAGRPGEFAKYHRQLWFDKPFDLSTYGVLIKYFQNVHQVDRTEGATTVFTRILRNWRACLSEGVRWKVLESEGDADADKSEARYERLKGNLLVREISYGGEWEGFTL